MKRSWAIHIIGCFFILTFLLSGIIPDVLIVSGQLSNKAATAAVAGQEAMNAERSTEETKGALRVECLTDHPSFAVAAPEIAFHSHYIIPLSVAYTQRVFLAVPTPPPDI